jgi:ribokinase
MARDVYVVGSINVDLVVTAATLPGPGETVAGGTFERHGGGKGANQAVSAARLGARVRMVGAVGDDDLGEEAVGLLRAEGIDVSGLVRLERRATGVALIVVDEAGENQIAVASGANAELDAGAVERALREAGGVVSINAGAVEQGLRDAARGVVLLGLEVPDGPVLAGARTARAADLQLVLNPAPARELPGELLDLSPLLTPNRDESRALAGEDDPERAARVLADRTGAPVVVTLGAEGALVVDGDALERVPAPRVEAVDTTGAGDAFNGALACELAGGAALLDAVRAAVAVAAESTRVPGARTVVRPRRSG